jgi:hypothetical protein
LAAEVTFTVISGPNQGETGTAVTNASGQATFTWVSDSGAGTDVVQASFMDAGGATRTATANKIWATVAPIPSIPVEGIPVALATLAGLGLIWHVRRRFRAVL